ncbi:26S proteasome non-ATPase regulatory subunit 14 [Trichinella pseudospiralis]|uniref:26S proteasome non-ATPase regulatory subunit 14 n=3 Tax=Trichinella pseudospiralis TaxID=6337 RepID=A0A0V1JHD0_TRIPS|nr:26S proteasome non-ATPase regulatory subunit 14 [Trichinella pseudospiralis]KRZ34393.1 26S proteasome non-ATPase regulatory subunit 14 [Trichinella pseudospiralis]
MERFLRLGAANFGGFSSLSGGPSGDTPAVDTAEQVYISSLALLKMLKHGRAGVPMEVMGLMLGDFVDDYTVRVVDVFAMPQSGTGVSVEAVDPVFQARMLEMLRQTGRPEMVVGWYHSHPGFGCWLSGVDINTQQSFEALSERAVAVVIDPIQSVKGKVVIDAFRLINAQTILAGHEPRQTTSNLGHLKKPSIQALIHGLNRHYYSISINYRMNDLEAKMLESLHKHTWITGLQMDTFSNTRKKNLMWCKTIADCAKSYKKALEEEEKMTPEQLAIKNVGKKDPKRHLEETVDAMLDYNILQCLGTSMNSLIVRLSKVDESLTVKQKLSNSSNGINLLDLPEVLQENTNESDSAQYRFEEYTFSWLEKQYSQREIEEAAQRSQGPLCESGFSDRRTNRLFSRIDVFYFSSAEKSSIQAKNVNERKPQFKHCRIAPTVSRFAYLQKPVIEMPTREKIKEQHLQVYSTQEMKIMAYLGEELTEKHKIEDEFLLCTIQLINSKYLRVMPDFNFQTKKPYEIHSRTGFFQYTVECLSDITVLPADLELNLLKKSFDESHEKYSTNKLYESSEFDFPQKRSLRIVYYGEITSAEDFEYSHLLVHYFLDIPKGWACKSEKMSGVTQTCLVKNICNNGRSAYFAFPIELELCLDLDYYYVSEDYPMWPQLFLTVMSLDTYNRYRLEGYGYMSLPADPGISEHIVNTWRPAEDVISNMRRYFIGGSFELEDVLCCRYAKSFEGERILSKYGFRTVSSGSVKLKFYSIHQCRNLIRNNISRYGSLLYDARIQLGFSSSVLRVLEVFQRARQKMIAIQETVRSERLKRLQDSNNSD